MQLFLILFILIGLKRNCQARIDPQRNSLLLYLDEFRDEFDIHNISSYPNATRLTEACSQRLHDNSVYYRMIYFRICEKNLRNFNQFCSDLEAYFHGNASLKVTIDAKGNKEQIFGFGVKSNERFYAWKACKNIYDYYAAKTSLNIENNSSTVKYPNYTEWFIHSIPFALPIACGFTRERYSKHVNPPSISRCLSRSYKWALYSTFIIDGLIILAITITNVIVLIVSRQTRMTNSTHGQLRVSLAMADLLTVIVVCGSINTTYRVYFGPHKFTEDGERASMLDYHTQDYINGFGSVTVATLAASVFTLVAISVDRFVAVFRPFTYKFYSEKIHICNFLSIFCIWIVSLLISIPPIFLPTTPYAVTALGVIIAPDFYLVYVICLGGSLLCVWILNIWMCLSLKKRKTFLSKKENPKLKMEDYKQSSQKPSRVSADISVLSEVCNLSSSSSVESSKTDTFRRRKKNKSMELLLVSTVQTVVVAFSIAIIPAIIVMTLGMQPVFEPSSKHFDPKAKALWNSFAYISSRIIFSNSFFNCFIYGSKCSKFREGVKSLFSCFFKQNQQKKPIRKAPTSFYMLTERKRSSVKSIQETI